jgi:metallo-beta-lactamase family protein
MKITFLGATDTVTGSRFLIETKKGRLLVDCGLFQGLKRLRERNWAAFPVAPASIDAVVLTHAHIDHSGYIPALFRDGFKANVWSTAATRALCDILLPDAAHLQEEEAAFANKHKFSRHHPARPLYNGKDAKRALRAFRSADFGEEFTPIEGVTVRFSRAGHILGAACAQLRADGRCITFSGDVGRPGDPIMYAPETLADTDYLVLESTYGDRRHPATHPWQELGEIVNRTIARGGSILIPSFAVGRAQSVLYGLSHLMAQGQIPVLPVFLDSPMAINATELFCRFSKEHRLSANQCRDMCETVTCTRSPRESRAAMAQPGAKIVISASGMATGGRVLHHLKADVVDERNTIVFAGFQAAGTRGARMLAGAESIKVHGAYYPVRAEIAHIDGLSAHADGPEMIMWLQKMTAAPKQTFIVHGEPSAQDAMRLRIKDELNWEVRIPDFMETVRLK